MALEPDRTEVNQNSVMPAYGLMGDHELITSSTSELAEMISNAELDDEQYAETYIALTDS